MYTERGEEGDAWAPSWGDYQSLWATSEVWRGDGGRNSSIILQCPMKGGVGEFQWPRNFLDNFPILACSGDPTGTARCLNVTVFQLPEFPVSPRLWPSGDPASSPSPRGKERPSPALCPFLAYRPKRENRARSTQARS